MTRKTRKQENIQAKREAAALVRAAQAGSRAAFGQLFQRYERHVYLIALRCLGTHADAEELCQDVFLQAMLKIHQLRRPECFGGWLRAITQRMAVNRLVRRGPELVPQIDRLAGRQTDAQTPLDAVLDGERSEQVHTGLEQLGELDRQTLVAFYVKGQSLRQMSDHFDAPVGTIKRRLHVARKRLAKQVGELVAV